MRRLAWLSFIVMAGCASPSATLEVSVDPSAPTDAKPSAARTAAWLIDMDNAAVAASPGELEVELAGESSRLELASLRVDVRTVGSMARYEVEHVFHNQSDQQLEGTFRFPLPTGAIVTGLAMEIDGQLMEGEILERERAREIFEEIVDSMRDPALLEWEAGQTFKLRVFPILPGERKRVVMRYMAPLLPDEAAPSGFVAAIPTAVPAMQTEIGALAVSLDGELALDETHYAARENLRLPVAVGRAPSFVEEREAGQRYFAARVDLDWTQVPASTRAPSSNPRRAVIVVDSSRSALESWALAQQAAATVLAQLGPTDEFMLIAADLEARSFAPSFVVNSPAARADALEFLAGIEPDGASDLGRALASVGEALRDRDPAALDQVIYVGDGTPTWGVSDPQQLVELTREALAGAPLFAVSVGKRESRDLLETLTGATGGRTVRPETLAQVEAFGEFLERAPTARRLADVRVEIPGVEQVHAPLGKTWFEGERPTVHFHLPEDQPLPHELIVRGEANGELFTHRVALGEPVRALGVRQQWAARQLAVTTDKLAAVALSVEHSVLSRHTALLVLESEEAYERYAIERRNQAAADRAAAADAPEISGRDLDGEDASPYLGPGDLQPGDPEIFIPAPRDAISVELMFPFGETKAARWEDEVGQWSARFLVDDDVEPGTYAVMVRITHADGRVELLELEYTIDVEAPTLELELRARDDGAYDVLAHQVLTAADAARERPEGVAGGERARTLDARRVELIMPDGQTLQLRRGLDGQFERRWEPRGEVEWPATVTAVIGDRALNSRRVELSLERPRGGRR